MTDRLNGCTPPLQETPPVCEQADHVPPAPLPQLQVTLGTGYTFGSDLYFDGQLSVDAPFGAGIPISHGIKLTARFEKGRERTDIFIHGTRGSAKGTSSLKDVIPDIETSEDPLVGTILGKIDTKTENALTTHGIKVGFMKPLIQPWEVTRGVKMFSLDAGLAVGMIQTESRLDYFKRDLETESANGSGSVWKKDSTGKQDRTVAPLVTAVFSGELLRVEAGPFSFAIEGGIHLGGGLVFGGTDLGGLLNFGWTAGARIGIAL
jgi:hypothetical protein